ncbi:diacylglycerol/lipid kinase family protein [Neorhodopirellula lusitana]|uniref:diacylglycerol/lipid kinase family protein n=1 Tax=Neorhodopirellula lusitana TaxID=445327 RepID=UPI00384B243B
MRDASSNGSTNDPEASAVGRVAMLSSPRAGSGAGRDEIPRLVKLLAKDGIQLEMLDDPSSLARWCDELRNQPSHQLNDATPDHTSPSQTTPSQSARPRNVLIPAGGDGTITLAASMITSLDTLDNAAPAPDVNSQPYLLPMPLGTENLLARHYGHRAIASHLRDTLLHGQPTTVDMGIVRRASGAASPMLTMVSSGFDAEVVRRVHLKRTGHIRRSSYLGPVVSTLRQYKFPMQTVQAIGDDGSIEREVKCGWAMVFNLPCYGGGLAIEPDALGNDGLFDVITFAGQSVTRGFRYFAGIHLKRHLKDPDITRFRAKRIRIQADARVHYQIDGDYISRLPIDIELRPNAISLLAPR